MSLRQKAISGFSWTTFEGIFSQGVLFLVGIILANLLDPKDFGLIGIITAFMSISNIIIEGGFSNALLRKIDVDHFDYNTIFYTNICIAVFLYGILFITAPSVGIYFDEPQLIALLRVGGLIMVINALSIIQQTLLSRLLDFKTKGVISVISTVLSGFIAVLMAFNEFGVWSLMALSLLRPALTCIILWIKSNWKPSLLFSLTSFKELFGFGSKLLLANLLNAIYRNIYYLLIGKFFSTSSLGFYSRADQFQAPFSNNITRAVSRISYPILSRAQENPDQMKAMFVKFFKFATLINMTILTFIAGAAESIVLVLIGEKWETSIYYLQLLCIPGMLYPLQVLNIELNSVLGYSDRYLKMEVIKKVILIPLVIVTVFFSIEVMLYGLISFAFVEYFINSQYSKRLIDYSSIDQLKSIFPIILVCLSMFLGMRSVEFLHLDFLNQGLVQLLVGTVIMVGIHEYLKIDTYLEIKGQLSKVLKLGNKPN
ncbi:lipopolysaccharide biosynthesis protein [Flagellimonas lutaonensis]|uniref:Lipopolysaccharide biosynthesis protein n=1 Tax=Flagellimonas lutaonensis TaxID=516051 RepID=A0A0D5YV32_9FLAO|nr:lipopolysaccharide biosynthesis protein [Allomuricauda lutaonensis]AKA36080.1 hypothetical protein VC82_2508 [Allomuricauda lutaonensis]